MYVPSVTELVGDRDEFFGRHFDRAPMVRRAALERDPRELLSVADFDQVLDSAAIRAPHRPNLRALADAMSDLFATRCDVIGFLTPAGRHALAPHHDPDDVFVVQVEGTQLWRVYSRRGHDDAEPGAPAIETTLRPGDVLYIPYDCPYVAHAPDSVSLHLSVSVVPRHWGTLLQEVVADVVTADPRFWDNPWLRDPRTASDLPAMLALLADQPRDDAAVDAIGPAGPADRRVHAYRPHLRPHRPAPTGLTFEST